MRNSDCIDCEYCRPFTEKNGFDYLGCTCGFYHHESRWIAEIEHCPKKERNKTIALLLDSIETARIYAGALGGQFGNAGDKDNLIRFYTTRDILRDLAENLKAVKFDSK